MGSVPEQIATQLVINVTGRALTWAGQQLWKLATEGDENAKRVLDKAEARLSDEARHNGPVSLRVFKEFLEQAPFIEDELTADYFGGVLASSRTGIDRDDRGAAFAQMIGRLSSYQLRAHYIIFATCKRVYDGTDAPDDDGDGSGRKVFIPEESWCAAMGFSSRENPEILNPHALNGLHREGLIHGAGFADDTKKSQENLNFRSSTPGLIVYPSYLGYELFLWANGLGRVGTGEFFERSIVFLDCSIGLPVDAQAAAAKW
jgi:hypothetical protein